MDRETLLTYIDRTPNIEFVSDLAPDKLSGDYAPLFLLECKLDVAGKSVPINLCVTKWFPQHLPLFFLDKYDTLGFLPHIEPKGSICYLEKESVYINTEEPEVVFQASVEMAVQTLEDGLNGTNHKDFREEFHVFWDRNTYRSSLHVMSFIDVGNEPKKIHILKNQKKAIVFDADKDIERQKKIHFGSKGPQAKSGIYIPLRLDCDVIPPKYDQIWSGTEFVNWLKPQVSDEHWQHLVDSILSKKAVKFEYLLLGIPRETGSTILIGVHLKPKKENPYPLLTDETNWGIDLLKIDRLDTPAFLPRGGAKLELQNKSVLLVGCGSVGSHLAIDLAKSGVGRLQLVDPDKIELENLQRFAIGFQFVGKAKVEAIKEHLDRNFLFTVTQSFKGKLEKFLDDKATDIKEYDLVISATGDPTMNLYLNKLANELDIPLLIGWNEPLGVGGHAQLSVPEQRGCYRCLYRNTYNTASFAAKEQPKPFHRKHLGCGEVYTPFSALDSIRTSVLMAQTAIAFLTGASNQAQIASWKGDKSDFESEGFKLSNRYTKQTQEEMNANRFGFVQDSCPHCSHLR